LFIKQIILSPRADFLAPKARKPRFGGSRMEKQVRRRLKPLFEQLRRKFWPPKLPLAARMKFPRDGAAVDINAPAESILPSLLR
jgi:hypothetical protein